MNSDRDDTQNYPVHDRSVAHRQERNVVLGAETEGYAVGVTELPEVSPPARCTLVRVGLKRKGKEVLTQTQF